MRAIAFILFYFFCANIKAQDNQAKPLKFVIADEMQNERDNDTTGKYRIGIPPKRVIEAAATKTESDKIEKKENVSIPHKDEKKTINKGPINIIPPVAAPPIASKPNSNLEEIRKRK